MLRGLRLTERRGPLRHVAETVGVFPRVGLERLCGRPSLGMVGVSLCRGVVLGAAPALGHVPQGGGLGYGGGMSAFTALTAWLAFSPMELSVLNCGCFGEVFTLEHGATLLKNVLLWALAVWNLWVV